MRPFQWHTSDIEPMPILIEASAGTGKTYAITGLFLRLLLEGHVTQVREILVVTFTNAATRELTERIRKRLREALEAFHANKPDKELAPLVKTHGAKGIPILKRACLELEELSIFTIHSFCKRMLEQNAFESGLTFTPTFLENHDDILTQAASDFWRTTFIQGPPLLATLAVTMQWSPSSLLEATNDCRAQHGVQFLPRPIAYDQALEELQESMLGLGQHGNPTSLLPEYEALPFYAGKAPHLKGSVSEFFEDLRQAASATPSAASLLAVLSINQRLNPESLKKAAQKDPAISLFLQHPFWQACRHLARSMSQFETSFRLKFLEEVTSRFRELKLRSHQLDFDDLLQQMHDVLADPIHGQAIQRAISFQFKAALIDEFQDTDQKQFEIFYKLFPQSPLFFIGDPKQAIYSFRGADLHAYLEARKVTGRQYTLDTNWRSHRHLVEAVNHLFGLRKDPFLVENINYRPVLASGTADNEAINDGGQALHFWLVPPGRMSSEVLKEQVLGRMAKEILRLLDDDVQLGDRRIHPHDLAILVRTHHQADAVLKVLRRFRIPATVSGKGDIFQTREMDELLLFIRAVIHPQQPFVLQAAMTTTLWGGDATQIAALSQDAQSLAHALNKLEGLRAIWQRLGFLAMMHTAFGRLGTLQRLLAKPQGKLRLTYLRHAAEVIQQHSNRTTLSPDGLVRWLQAERNKLHHDGLDTQLRTATDELGVQIMTVHKSKGLEYQIVFCPFFWKEPGGNMKRIPKFHDADGTLFFDLQNEPESDHQSLAGQELKAEDLRLLYVALTRARQRCYLVWSDAASGKNLALGTFFDQGSQTLEHWAKQWPQLMQAEPLIDPEADEEEPDGYLGNDVVLPLQPPKPFSGIRYEPWRMTSFTSLTANQDHAKAHRYDPSVPRQEGFGSGIFGFARGARAGNCLHEVLEHVPFDDIGSADSQKMIQATLSRYDLADPQRHLTPINPQEEVGLMLKRVLGAPLPQAGFSLASLKKADQLTEWPFHLPLEQFQPGDFQKCFRQFGNTRTREEYAPLLGNLSSDRRWEGFLTGIVDLCFTQHGRWYLLDWKSNDLGPTLADYNATQIWQSMCDHHYIFQYHLYTLALHRFLRTRLRNYRYQEHLGGVYYAFLRGIDGASESGWYFDKPDWALIEAFDRSCSGGGVP